MTNSPAPDIGAARRLLRDFPGSLTHADVVNLNLVVDLAGWNQNHADQLTGTNEDLAVNLLIEADQRISRIDADVYAVPDYSIGTLALQQAQVHALLALVDATNRQTDIINRTAAAAAHRSPLR